MFVSAPFRLSRAAAGRVRGGRLLAGDRYARHGRQRRAGRRGRRQRRWRHGRQQQRHRRQRGGWQRRQLGGRQRRQLGGWQRRQRRDPGRIRRLGRQRRQPARPAARAAAAPVAAADPPAAPVGRQRTASPPRRAAHPGMPARSGMPSAEPVPSPACAGGAMMPGPNGNQTFMDRGKNRSFIIRMPTGYDGKKPFPIFFGFHGAGGGAAGFETGAFGGVSRMLTEKAIRVVPAGVRRQHLVARRARRRPVHGRGDGVAEDPRLLRHRPGVRRRTELGRLLLAPLGLRPRDRRPRRDHQLGRAAQGAGARLQVPGLGLGVDRRLGQPGPRDGHAPGARRLGQAGRLHDHRARCRRCRRPVWPCRAAVPATRSTTASTAAATPCPPTPRAAWSTSCSARTSRSGRTMRAMTLQQSGRGPAGRRASSRSARRARARC